MPPPETENSHTSGVKLRLTASMRKISFWSPIRTSPLKSCPKVRIEAIGKLAVISAVRSWKLVTPETWS